MDHSLSLKLKVENINLTYFKKMYFLNIFLLEKIGFTHKNCLFSLLDCYNN